MVRRASSPQPLPQPGVEVIPPTRRFRIGDQPHVARSSNNIVPTVSDRPQLHAGHTARRPGRRPIGPAEQHIARAEHGKRRWERRRSRVPGDSTANILPTARHPRTPQIADVRRRFIRRSHPHAPRRKPPDQARHPLKRRQHRALRQTQMRSRLIHRRPDVRSDAHPRVRRWPARRDRRRRHMPAKAVADQDHRTPARRPARRVDHRRRVDLDQIIVRPVPRPARSATAARVDEPHLPAAAYQERGEASLAAVHRPMVDHHRVHQKNDAARRPIRRPTNASQRHAVGRAETKIGPHPHLQGLS
jgi:hypothetical protein